MICCSLRARVTTARWRKYSSTGISSTFSGSKFSNRVDDEVDSFGAAHADLEELACSTWADEHDHVVELKDSCGVAGGVTTTSSTSCLRTAYGFAGTSRHAIITPSAERGPAQ